MVRISTFAMLVIGVASMQQRASRPHAAKEPIGVTLTSDQDSKHVEQTLEKAGVKLQYPKMSAADSLETEVVCPPADWKNPYGSGPWREARKGTSLCSDGKVIPQVYLLGAMKAGTSSIAFDLSSRGVMPVDGDKEFHFFGHKFDKSKKDFARQKWLGLMPDCPQQGEPQQILGDYTPHMHYIPASDDYLPLGPGTLANYSLPWLLKDFYSDKEKERLVFVASLRKPLSRMQSAWYAGRKCSNHCICTWCRHESFVESLRVQLQEWQKSPRGVSDWLWASMYGHQLEVWLKYFPPERLVVQPFGHYSDHGISELCEAVSEKSGFHLVCDPIHKVPLNTDNESEDVPHKWNTKHPPLDKDVPAELLHAYDKLLHDDGEKLVRILTKAHSKGATLVGYTGEKGNAVAVEKWLKVNW